MPNDVFDCAYTLHPLKTGYCSLPNFHLKFNQTEQIIENTNSIEFIYKNIDAVIQNMISKEIFILPKDYELLKERGFSTTEIIPIKK
jgi:hypothetical protein